MEDRTFKFPEYKTARYTIGTNNICLGVSDTASSITVMRLEDTLDVKFLEVKCSPSNYNILHLKKLE